MKKNQRVAALLNELQNAPGKLYSMKYFCDKFDVAKSSLSEDVTSANQVLEQLGNGCIETASGVGGGIRYISGISDEECLKVQNELKDRLSDPSRILGGGFLYTSDIFYDIDLVYRMARIFAREFRDVEADYIVTVETKGIPLAGAVSYAMNIPLVVIRREAKYAEGSTVSINYFSGSYDRIQRMSLAKRAVKPGGRAIVIDDFMRGGGSLKGIHEILGEFDVTVEATGVAIVSRTPEKKRINDYLPLTFIDDIDEESKRIDVSINSIKK